MEKGKKSIILLVAFILGIGFLFLWGLATYDNLTRPSRIERSQRETYELLKELNPDIDLMSYEDFKKTLEDAGLSPYTWWALTSFIISIPAVLLNFFGWFKNRAKNILIAAILYLLSLNIPSAVLCFIGFRKLKKQKGA